MESSSFICLINLPTWPVSASKLLHFGPIRHSPTPTTLQVEARPEGYLSVSITSENQTITACSQQLKVSNRIGFERPSEVGYFGDNQNPSINSICLVYQDLSSLEIQKLQSAVTGDALLVITWRDERIRIYLNGREVKLLEESDGEVFTVEQISQAVEPPPPPTLSEILEACKEWLDWRKHRYANPKPTAKTGRRIKTLQEQVAELQTATNTLNELIERVRAGEEQWTGHLATELRGLVYWKEGNSKYNPLLLRLAGRFSWPLPVVTNMSVMKGKTVVDLQEWLARPIILFGESGDLVEITAKEFILETATSTGTSHYDDDVPHIIDISQRSRGIHHDLSTRMLLFEAQIIAEHCMYLLAHIQNHRY